MTRSDEALAHLLGAFAGRPVALQRPPDLAPGAPAVLRRDALLLAPPPPGMDADAWAHAAVLHAAAHLRHSPPGRPVGRRKTMSLALASTIEDARVERLAGRRYPGLLRALRAAGPPPPDAAASLADRLAQLHAVLRDPSLPATDFWLAKARRLFEDIAAGPGVADAAAFDPLVTALVRDLGQMRQRMNIHGEAPASPYGDDHSYLWNYGRAAEDEALELRTAAPPPADAGGPPPPADAPAAGDWTRLPAETFDYPEWHARIGQLRRDWCTVFEHRLPPLPAGVPVRERRAGRGRLDRSRRLRNQWEGEDFDLDAAIEQRLDLRLGCTPARGAHVSPGRSREAAAILLLIDLSASVADAAGNGLRVLDLVAEAAAALVAAATAAGERVAVHGFCSDGRSRVDYLELAAFGTTDAAAVADRVRSAGARHSTRLGAALRHAASRLREETAPRRHIVVLGDAQPSDIDVFDDLHLPEDAAVAVRCARRDRLGVACLAFAVDGDDRIPVGIFGRGATVTADDPATLSFALARLRRKLAFG
ncbi:nitric oxide reductase activation protein NorD [Pseudothauera rhizosphaerae]|uniref:VWA domain-containing protein n=1 Tax=Pseudothauera rhizosphaerae TaxID=2565932 RepID=A0A4S4AJ66_9RHOO|nr:VWA domain-containing protein [Pseudothauera rhizosphaerae]THF59438.1 VWA domain-containing protein [Pseudothauera rhizosphaerae]